MTPEEEDYITRAIAAVRADEPKQSVIDYLEQSMNQQLTDSFLYLGSVVHSMYLHIERKKDQHNSVAMIDDVVSETSETLNVNGDDIEVSSIEMFNVVDSYKLSLVTEDDVPIAPNGKVVVMFYGEKHNWEITGELSDITCQNDVTEVVAEGIENIRKRSR